MNIYARIDNAVVAEIVHIPDGKTPDDCFHSDVAKQFKLATSEVQQGWRVEGESFFAPLPSLARDLNEIKIELKIEIDSAAEIERLKYITSGTGQAMTYQQKVAEAQSYKAATNPKPVDFPILASEVGITAPTLSEVADTVLAAYRQWQQIGAGIEAVRLGAKRDIDVAGTEAAARAVVDSISWP